MKKNIIERNKDETGVVIIEATFVFPIMFFVLFFLIYIGNTFYIRAQIEELVQKKAVEGAAYCADPILQTLKENKGRNLPGVKTLEGKPYRYIFGGMGAIENKIINEIDEELKNGNYNVFKGMSPKLHSKDAKFNNYIVYSTFSVEVMCTVEFPINFFGNGSPTIFKITSRGESPTNDAAEFIRNTDLVLDVIEETKLGEKIDGIFEKIKGVLSSFSLSK